MVTLRYALRIPVCNAWRKQISKMARLVSWKAWSELWDILVVRLDAREKRRGNWREEGGLGRWLRSGCNYGWALYLCICVVFDL